MTRNRLSIYVSSPDSYSDVFSVFYRAFFRYWKDCPYDFYLTTNTQAYEDIKCIQNNKPGDTWVERTLAAMPKIDSKYLLLMCDDIIISDTIDNDNIERILDYMERHNIKYCRLKPLGFGDFIEELPLLRKVNKETPYAINLQVGIFKKDYFEELLGDGSLSAWDIENKVNYEASKADDEYFEDVVSVSSDIIPFIHGVYKGKWIKSSVSLLKRRGLWNENPERELTSLMTTLKIQIIEVFQRKMSSKARKKVKKVLAAMGWKFETRF